MTERFDSLTYVADMTAAAAGATGNKSMTNANAAGEPWAAYLVAVKGAVSSSRAGEWPVAVDMALQADIVALVGSASTGMDTLGEIENYILANVMPALGNKADIFSPAFTGNPTAPTPASTDSDTSLATTAFVQAVLAAFKPPSDGKTYAMKNGVWIEIKIPQTIDAIGAP
jgi:hypothetical protein